MIKTKNIKYSIEKEVIEDIICNKCGNSCVFRQNQLNFKIPFGLIEANVVSGYFSPKLQDEMCYTFSLCESCLVDLFKEFIVPVKATEIYSTIDLSEQDAETRFNNDQEILDTVVYSEVEDDELIENFVDLTNLIEKQAFYNDLLNMDERMILSYYKVPYILNIYDDLLNQNDTDISYSEKDLNNKIIDSIELLIP